ncbi:flagellar assembly protein FliH [Lebetimonas natsushimae]|uniref:Flagellar assembly protein FliH n=1 Tax=Lebetimonas natsushimae TaxID=1936991 RepID=A0A292YDP4_9BACT|nr:flagellar assembly protein FliH [Lebetimonas natsushimae]GAX87506.1 flagellar assembly protein FliH [Lebetimonas natsushimae]
MSKIISKDNSDTHVVKSYKFKELDDTDFQKVSFQESQKNETVNESQDKVSQSSVSNQNDELIERLLNKIEELSNNIINIENNFNNQLNECKKQIETEKQKAYEEGYKKGLEEGKKEIESLLGEKIKLLEDSIEKIDKINETFEEKIISIEKELISVALDIAKEVIQKEVSENSKEIAYNLAKSLMDEIKEATKIKIKVNPKDAQFLKSKDLKNVEILEDPAVKEGGVVIISDVGNIDAEIISRFKAIKEAILEERNSEN